MVRTVREERRRCGVTELEPGDHVCWPFDTDEDYAATLASWIETGVTRGERVLSLSGQVSVDWLRAAVTAHGVPVDALIEAGQAVLADARTVFAGTGSFDADGVTEGYRLAAEQAVADGYTALRVMADLGWAANGLATPRQLVCHELSADRLIADLPMLALCGYDTRIASRTVAAQVCSVHPACAHDGSTPFCVLTGADGSFVVRGEVDFACAQSWRVVLDALAAGSDEQLTLDVGGLDFIDLTGLRALVAVADELAAYGGWLTLRSARPVLRRCAAMLNPPESLRWSD